MLYLELPILSTSNTPLEDFILSKAGKSLNGFTLVDVLRYFVVDGVASIELVLKEVHNTEASVCLLFMRPRMLNVRGFVDIGQQITGLTAENISGRGMENLNWRVFDYENDVIDFFCERIFLATK